MVVIKETVSYRQINHFNLFNIKTIQRRKLSQANQKEKEIKLKGNVIYVFKESSVF
jgi:hypothetical protein